MQIHLIVGSPSIYILVLHRPQLLPPLVTSSYFGNGGGGGSGGYAQMRAVSGNFSGSNWSSDAKIPVISNHNDCSAGYRKHTLLSNPSTQPPNANVALAAARQTLMGRLAAGGTGSFVQLNTIKPIQIGGACSSPTKRLRKEPQQSPHKVYSESPVPTPSNPSLSSTSFLSPFTQSPKTQAQHPLPTQTFGFTATSTSTATNANENLLGTTKTTNSCNAININSTPKPFYNALQSSMWKCKFSCR